MKTNTELHKDKDFVFSNSKSMGFEMSGVKDQDIAFELGEARKRYFERTFGKKIDDTLIGEDELETSHLNQDLMDVTTEMKNMLRKSREISQTADKELQLHQHNLRGSASGLSL